MKLNIGAGATLLPGYESWDIAQGKPAYPLALGDRTVEAIYASHVLEHFPHGKTVDVLKDWVRALKPGGLLQVAVPDFQEIARRFMTGEQGNWEGYVMGGQVDGNDLHRAIFNRGKLKAALEAAGLTDIKPWTAVIQDCASLPISLNLQGRKPMPAAPDPDNRPHPVAVTAEPDTRKRAAEAPAKVVAVWSVPRLGFMDAFKSIYCGLPPFGIPMVMGQGVFWGQALEVAMENAIRQHGAEWFLSLDYDSVFTPQDLSDLFGIVGRHPQEIDCLCPFEWSRSRDKPLWTPLEDAAGALPNVTNMQLLENEIFPIGTGHFGLTLIRADVVKRMPKPWFMPHPAPDGGWGEGKVDDDIHFWRGFRKAGGRMFLAPRVTLGHVELALRWPGRDLSLLTQHFHEYNDTGKPAGVFGREPATPTPTPTAQG